MLLIVSNPSDGKDINNKNKNSQHMLRVAGEMTAYRLSNSFRIRDR